MGISWPRFAVALQKDNEELAGRSTQISMWSEIKAVAFDAFPVFDPIMTDPKYKAFTALDPFFDI
jgi:hypothetical protein